jgi:hypothetical protein
MFQVTPNRIGVRARENCKNPDFVVIEIERSICFRSEKLVLRRRIQIQPLGSSGEIIIHFCYCIALNLSSDAIEVGPWVGRMERLLEAPEKVPRVCRRRTSFAHETVVEVVAF